LFYSRTFVGGVCTFSARGPMHGTDLTPGCNVQFTRLSVAEMPLLLATVGCHFGSCW